MKNRSIIEEINGIIEKQEYTNVDILEELISGNQDVKEIAKALMTILFKKNEVVQEEEEDRKRPNYEERRTNYGDRRRNNYEDHYTESGYVKLFLNLGKKDRIMPKDIVGSMIANTAISGGDIGKISILENFSFVEVPNNYIEEAIEEMRGKQIKGRDVNIEIATGRREEF